jgi:hypothetical protein
MEDRNGVPFSEFKMTLGKFEQVFNLFLFERNLWIKRGDKLLTYWQYLSWVRENYYAKISYDGNLREYNEFKTKSSSEKIDIWGRTQEDILNRLIELKIIMMRDGEKENQFKDQLKYWKKNWAVDESRFVKKINS